MSGGGEDMVNRFETDIGSWESLARSDPLWAVLSRDELHSDVLTAEAEAEFWRSGEEHVDHVLAVIGNEIEPGFTPGVSVDFGCGVGRALLPLARRSRHAIGLDASPTMLDRARSRLDAAGLLSENAVLVTGRTIDREAVEVFGAIDFVHSVLVFQHIVPEEGLALFDQLLELLAPGGFGFVQFICRCSGGEWARLVRHLRLRSGWINALALRSRLSPLTRVEMLYEYEVLELLRRCAAHRVTDVVLERVDTGPGGYEARLYFRKDAGPDAPASALKVRLRP